MISENALDLIARVTSITAFANSASFTLGGHGVDPALVKIPLPAAWVLYRGDGQKEDSDEALVPGVGIMLSTWSVILYVPYAVQSDLLTVQFPLLESVITTIRGKTAPSGHRWRYDGQKLVNVLPDRIAYEQRYTLTMVI